MKQTTIGQKRVCAYIDTDRLVANLQYMKQLLPSQTKIFAVIKADAYGHGAVALARVLEPYDYIEGYAFATVGEAVKLRQSGIQKKLILLGESFFEDDSYIIENQIIPTVTDKERALALSTIATKRQVTLPIQIKLDTGMHRIGMRLEETSYQEIADIFHTYRNLYPYGLFTHFACADETDVSYTKQQWEGFHQAICSLKDRGIEFETYHCANSAAIFTFSPAYLTHVRAGIAMYGIEPSPEVDIDPLQPILSLKSHITFVKTVTKGSAISYGGTFVTNRKTRLATIPVGYGDGYPRSLSNQGYVLIHGKKAPICGRVCMDQFMVDITDIPQAKRYDTVTLIGTDKTESIRIEELAKLSNRFPYEFACCINQRVPRVYKGATE